MPGTIGDTTKALRRVSDSDSLFRARRSLYIQSPPSISSLPGTFKPCSVGNGLSNFIISRDDTPDRAACRNNDIKSVVRDVYHREFNVASPCLHPDFNLICWRDGPYYKPRTGDQLSIFTTFAGLRVGDVITEPSDFLGCIEPKQYLPYDIDPKALGQYFFPRPSQRHVDERSR